jgi:gamma-glutamyl:cysteine ligase YbdK (ATP-grasp superfamily)
MALETLERDDLSIYVIGGVPRSFKAKLQQFVRTESKKDGDVFLVDSEMTEWIVARLRDAKRPNRDRTPASRALWRAFSALSAARYHLQNQETEDRVRELRMKVEELWREISPMFAEEEVAEVVEAVEAVVDDGA